MIKTIHMVVNNIFKILKTVLNHIFYQILIINLFSGHICKCKQYFWTLHNSFIHKLYVVCILRDAFAIYPLHSLSAPPWKSRFV